MDLFGTNSSYLQLFTGIHNRLQLATWFLNATVLQA
jgi:hypothetical protein